MIHSFVILSVLQYLSVKKSLNFSILKTMKSQFYIHLLLLVLMTTFPTLNCDDNGEEDNHGENEGEEEEDYDEMDGDDEDDDFPDDEDYEDYPEDYHIEL